MGITATRMRAYSATLAPRRSRTQDRRRGLIIHSISRGRSIALCHMRMNEPRRVSPREAHALMTDEQYTYVDVRSPDAFADGHPSGAVNVPLDDDFVTAMSGRFARDAKIVVGCTRGGRSLRAARAL